MRAAVGLVDTPLEIHKVTRWSVDAIMASRFQVGRVFLAGDAAHRHPPTGGLGLTSAIHDVNNLCWKLAAVLADQAVPELLETYEPERRSADERNAQRSLENAVNQITIVNDACVSHEHTPEQNWGNVRRLWSGRPEDAEHRSKVLRRIRMQSMEFNELNVELGYAYESKAIVPGGTPRPEPVDEIRVYEPSTRPGARLPHAWLDDKDGRRQPIKDLVAAGRFLLIAGEEGEAWCEAAREFADTGVPVDAVRIGHVDGDLSDPVACGSTAAGSASREPSSFALTVTSRGATRAPPRQRPRSSQTR